MKIEAMTATFGRLHQQTLTLTPGLNIISASNEAGKSTWCAFLLAMLYGVDTAERATRTNFPAKTRYRPWDGAAMEGVLKLEHNGRRITIERTSTAKSPLGVFRAYDTETGAPIEDLTAENCGQTLVGVPRAVFERSAFIRQGGISVNMDAGLEQRLSALVSSGDETISYTETEKRLRDLRNRCRHNKTGFIPQVESHLAQINQVLEQMDAVQEQIAGLQAQRRTAEADAALCRRRLAVLTAREAGEQRAQLVQAQQDAAEKIDAAKALEGRCAALPQPQQLQQWEQALTELDSSRRTLQMDAAVTACGAARPEPPAALAGLDSDAAREKAAQDQTRAQQLQAVPAPKLLPRLLPALALLLAGGVLLALRQTLPGGIALALAVLAGAAGLLLHGRSRRACTDARQELVLLLTAYDVQNPEDISAVAGNYAVALEQYRDARTRYEQELARQQARSAQLDRQDETLRGQMAQALHTGLADPAAARAAIDEAQALHRSHELARREAAQAYRHYEVLKQAVGELPEPEPVPDEPVPEGVTRAQLAAQLQQLEAGLQGVRSALDRAEGRLATLGDRMELEALRQQLEARLDLLNQENDALGVALVALRKANETLQTRFSPQLTALTGQYLSQLTGGVYSRVLLDRELNADLYPDQTPACRTSAYFSRGTQDQLYLALRLAVGMLLLGPDVPIILDDALVSFDDDRLRLALNLLRQRAAETQILLFTCQSREQQVLDTMTE